MSLAQWLSWVAALSVVGGTMLLPLQWSEFSSSRQTVSSLAALGAPSRPEMNAVFVVTVLCLGLIAVSLRGAAMFGRGLIAIAAVAGVLVIAYPLPAPDTDSTSHTLTVTVLAFALGFWPAAAHAGHRGRWAAPARLTLAVTVALVVLGVTFWLSWRVHGALTGLFERVFLFAEMASLVLFTHIGQKSSQQEPLASRPAVAAGTRTERV